MSKQAVVLTVQIILDKDVVGSESGACDYMSGMLSENTDVLDWAYTINSEGQYNYPEEILLPDDYEEGDFFPNSEYTDGRVLKTQ